MGTLFTLGSTRGATEGTRGRHICSARLKAGGGDKGGARGHGTSLLGITPRGVDRGDGVGESRPAPGGRGRRLGGDGEGDAGDGEATPAPGGCTLRWGGDGDGSAGVREATSAPGGRGRRLGGDGDGNAGVG